MSQSLLKEHLGTSYNLILSGIDKNVGLERRTECLERAQTYLSVALSHADGAVQTQLVVDLVKAVAAAHALTQKEIADHSKSISDFNAYSAHGKLG